MTHSSPSPDAPPDATAAYHLWDELFTACLRIALSAGDAEEAARARARLVRGHSRSLAERDAMWARIFRAMGRSNGD